MKNIDTKENIKKDISRYKEKKFTIQKLIEETEEANNDKLIRFLRLELIRTALTIKKLRAYI